jgi:hypothetical protein
MSMKQHPIGATMSMAPIHSSFVVSGVLFAVCDYGPGMWVRISTSEVLKCLVGKLVSREAGTNYRGFAYSKTVLLERNIQLAIHVTGQWVLIDLWDVEAPTFSRNGSEVVSHTPWPASLFLHEYSWYSLMLEADLALGLEIPASCFVQTCPIPHEIVTGYI